MNSSNKSAKTSRLQRPYYWLAARPYSVILLAALTYNVTAKFFWAYKLQLKGEFYLWILSDIAVILGIEVVFALIAYFRPRRSTVRVLTISAAVICTWSVINAGWIRRTGTQILPSAMLPLFRAPADGFRIIGGGLGLMPGSAVLILGCAAALLLFFFSVLVHPVKPSYKPRLFTARIILSTLLIVTAIFVRAETMDHNSLRNVAQGLKFNCISKAFVSIFAKSPSQLTKDDFANASRVLPRAGQIKIVKSNPEFDKNVVLVILEGVQYRFTSLADPNSDRTPFIASLAQRGLSFTDARSTMTHTTKALFAIHTGRYPSLSQDVAEAIPVSEPYASIPTILNRAFGHRTAFFQSANGRFEGRPGLVNNLGFDKFWSRDNCPDPNVFVGYLGSDEFAMLGPISEWIKSDDKPFMLTILCSVTHDPYEVPRWFAEPAEQPLDAYLQTIRYTDQFLEALDIELTNLGIADNTILCVVGDHGEAFGEHGVWTHERLAFDEALRVVMVIGAPGFAASPRQITQPVSSVDFAPTLLSLAGVDVGPMDFDGQNMLAPISPERKIYFSGWLDQSPAGYVQNDRKYYYSPAEERAFFYYIQKDPYELYPYELSENESGQIQIELADWKKHSLFKPEKPTGKTVLFDDWKIRWNGRVASAKFIRNEN
ncbi:MAG: sulfatase [Phycisphaerae bacterium]|jgi:phosphoglycerol transferase MdoB-like AlkP superfamily enzyme